MTAAKPIIMSETSVRALLAGRKTQTRRVIKPQPSQRPSQIMPAKWEWYAKRGRGAFSGVTADRLVEALAQCGGLPYAVGDRLWVREAFQTAMSDNGPCWLYRADKERVYPEFDGPDEGNGPSFNYERYPADYSHWAGDVEARGPWRSPLFMPRWASRLTLTVTEVMVERLQEISEADAVAEGAPFDDGLPFPVEKAPAGSNYIEDGWDCARDWYADLWESLHGPDAWAANPWVCAITFTAESRNIDGVQP